MTDWLDTTAYPFQHKFIDLTAGKIHYVDEGQGEPILFVHGTPTWSFEYRHLIGALRSHYRCIALDNLGFGLSQRPDNFAYTPEAHAKVLEDFVENLGLKSFILVAHDFGGPISLPLVLFTTKYVVRRLILINTWMWSFAEDAKMQRAARLAESWIGKLLYRYANFSLRFLTPYAFKDKNKMKAIHRQYLEPFKDSRAREKVLWTLAQALRASSDFYAELWFKRQQLYKKDILILWGMADLVLKPHLLQRWREAFPSAKVIEMRESGHWPHEEEPEHVASAIFAFLEATEWRKHTVNIRPLLVEDIPQLAVVHIKTWQATYRKIMSDEYLDSLSSKDFERRWYERLAKHDPYSIVFVAVLGGEIVGFVVGGQPRLRTVPCDCELYAINLLPKTQKMGIGKKLMRTIVLHFIKEQYASMFLQVAKENYNARQFYAHLGAQEFDELSAAESNHSVREIICVWKDLKQLLANLS